MPAEQQLLGVKLLDVLGQHEDRQAGQLGARLHRRPQALVSEGRRQPHIHHRHVRAVVDQGPSSSGPLSTAATTSMS